MSLIYVYMLIHDHLLNLYQKFSLFATWEGYRSSSTNTSSTSTSKEKAVFRVKRMMGMRKMVRLLRGYSYCKALIRVDGGILCEYKMENQSSKQSCRIVDTLGGLVAEVRSFIN